MKGIPPVRERRISDEPGADKSDQDQEDRYEVLFKPLHNPFASLGIPENAVTQPFHLNSITEAM